MNFFDIYYFIKPFLPRRLQVEVRSRIVLAKRPDYKKIWPIDENAGKPPQGWSGWPEGKKFAFVLTHDVEGIKGVMKCYELAKIDRDRGFRASFNFVPESCKNTESLHRDLIANGFEVGVHGLSHHGNLFSSRKKFVKMAEGINHYLKEWRSTGFRTPSMYHNLDWIGELHIEYDSSTFDTDPFEPQPDGMGTIFPFWVPATRNTQHALQPPTRISQHAIVVTPSVFDSQSLTLDPRPSILDPDSYDLSQPNEPNRPDRPNKPYELTATSHELSQPNKPNGLSDRIDQKDQINQKGFVELPYTLPQDFTLFVLMREKTIDIWKKKLDWVAEKGGMALLITHPDYMNFEGGKCGMEEYPVRFYEEMLDHIGNVYEGQYWHVLTKEIVSFWKEKMVSLFSLKSMD
jgi:peptidoglycan/xylan/chitin deacetylase (PgdA/CDA1 family)